MPVKITPRNNANPAVPISFALTALIIAKIAVAQIISNPPKRKYSRQVNLDKKPLSLNQMRPPKSCLYVKSFNDHFQGYLKILQISL